MKLISQMQSSQKIAIGLLLLSLIIFPLYQKILAILVFFIYNLQKGGSQHNLLYTIFNIKKPAHTVTGTVLPGFELVKETFESHFIAGMERNAQCCAYYKGEKVVDICGSFYDSQDDFKNSLIKGTVYNEFTLQNVFSSSKVVVPIVIAMLYERGHLEYDEKISKYWPEFAQNGKKDITIQEVLRHEAGLYDFDQLIDIELLTTENIKKNKVGEIIERQKPFPRYNEKKRKNIRYYHAVTRGFILNEIIRRVDPKKRTVGEFIREEISTPLNANFFIGAKKDELKNITYLTKTNLIWAFFQSWKFFGIRQFGINVLQFFLTKIFLSPNMKKWPYKINTLQFRQVEIPSANGQASAQGLAKIGQIIANKGKVDGITFLKESTIDYILSEPKAAHDRGLFGMETFFCIGGWNCMPNRYGWAGMGGSVTNFQPKLEYSFSYAPDLMEADLINSRGYKIHETLMKCIEKINN